MEILTHQVTVLELKTVAQRIFGNMIKVVVDVRKRIIAVDAELHADEESLLLENGSDQQDVWGINIYPDMDRNGSDFVEFDSMINLRPAQNNRTRGVEDSSIRETIIKIVNEWII